MNGRVMMLAAGGALAMLGGCNVRDGNQNAANDSAVVTAPAMPAPTPSEPTAPAAAATSLGTSTNENGELKLSVVEAVRSGGVLTIKAQLSLVAGKSGKRYDLNSTRAEDLYLVAGDQKYPLLKDNDGKPLSPDTYFPEFGQLGAIANWWGKFPAPGPEVKAVGFYFPKFAPVENVAITDR